MALTEKAAPYDIDISRDMKVAQERHGAGFGKQVSDFLALRMSGAGLTFEEYLYFGLFNRDRADYAAFMGDNRARAAFYVANDLSRWDEAEDKINFANIIASAGLAAPNTIAVAHAKREVDGALSLRNENELRDFLASAATPIFGKPARGSHGDNAISIEARRDGLLVDIRGEAMSIDDAVAAIAPFMEKEGYLFQERLDPHPEIAQITNGRLATVRFMVLIGADGAFVKDAVVRLPAGDNYVDNFRRNGNLVAAIDLDTGIFDHAVRGVGANAEAFDSHPDTKMAIKGVAAPDFERARRLAVEAAGLYPQQHIQSWDIALSDDGPKLLEVNPGGNFNLLQLARGRGVFDPQFREFLQWRLSESAGSKTNAKALKEAKKLLKLK